MKPLGSGRWSLVELTPLVDVVFLLIVFFLIAADASRLARPEADLVRGDQQARQNARWDAVLTLQADGAWRSSLDAPPLEDRAPDGLGAGSAVLLRVDRRADSAAMIRMASHLRSAGVERIDLALGQDARP